MDPIETRAAARPDSRAPRTVVMSVMLVVAMFVGMFALAPVWSWLAPWADDRPDVSALVMATNMSIGMAAWMLVRRHSWSRTAEMCAAMYVPFLVMLPPYWLGVVDGHAVMMVGHTLMFPAMLAVMVWRRADYYHHHH